MNIIRETKWALLELFPEQKETEAEAEVTAWNNARKAEAEANAESDKQAKETADKINQADSLIFQTEKQLKEFGDKLPADKNALLIFYCGGPT